MEKKTVKHTKEELEKIKSRTNWARLTQEEKSSDKKTQPTLKPRG